MNTLKEKNATNTYYIYLYINIHNVVAYCFVTVAAPSVYIQDKSPVIKLNDENKNT